MTDYIALGAMLAALSPAYKVNNLFERPDGLWQANLRATADDKFFAFGIAGTIDQALALAIANANSGLNATTGIKNPPAPKAAKLTLTLEDLDL